MAIDERGLVRSVHLFVCVHYAVKYYIVVWPVWVVNYVPVLSVMKFVSAVPTY